jgi:hypothetical protein
MYPRYSIRSLEHSDDALMLTRILLSGTSGTLTSLRISIGALNFFKVSVNLSSEISIGFSTPTMVAALIVRGISIVVVVMMNRFLSDIRLRLFFSKTQQLLQASKLRDVLGHNLVGSWMDSFLEHSLAVGEMMRRGY